VQQKQTNKQTKGTKKKVSNYARKNRYPRNDKIPLENQN
jgi:hypothetical protein